MKFSLPCIPPVDRRPSFRISPHVLLGVILLLAGLLRLFYFIEIQSNPLPLMTSEDKVFDQNNFVSMARDIMAHNWIGSETREQSPAYSYLIAALFKIFSAHINYVFLLQIMFGIHAVHMIYKSTSILFENKKTGLIAAFMMALYSPIIFYECAVLRAVLIAYMNLFGFYFLLKACLKSKMKYFLFSGIMIGVSTALRPGILGVFIIPYILIAVKGKILNRLSFTLLFIFGMAMVISPLTLRNKALANDAIVSTSSPLIFWASNAYDSRGLGYAQSRHMEKLEKEAGTKLSNIPRILWREIWRHPKEYRSLYGRKFKMLLNGHEIPANLSYDLARENSVILRMSVLTFTFVSPLALLGLFLAFGKYRHGSLLYVFFFALTFFIFIFHIQGRYRIPAVPFFIIFAAYALYWLMHMLKMRKYLALGCAAMSLVGLVLFTKPDHQIIQKFFGSPIRDIDYSNLAGAYLYQYEKEKGNLTEQEKERLLKNAIKNFEKTIAVCPTFKVPTLLLNKGMVYLEMNRYPEALKTFNQVLEFDPNNKIARDYIRVLQKALTKEK